jgi:hypothetical protein
MPPSLGEHDGWLVVAPFPRRAFLKSSKEIPRYTVAQLRWSFNWGELRFLGIPALDPNEKKRNVGGCHAANPGSVSECLWSNGGEFLSGLVAQTVDCGIVELSAKLIILFVSEALDHDVLPHDVASVFEVDFERLPQVRIEVGTQRCGKTGDRIVRPTQP